MEIYDLPLVLRSINQGDIRDLAPNNPKAPYASFFTLLYFHIDSLQLMAFSHESRSMAEVRLVLAVHRS